MEDGKPGNVFSFSDDEEEAPAPATMAVSVMLVLAVFEAVVFLYSVRALEKAARADMMTGVGWEDEKLLED